MNHPDLSTFRRRSDGVLELVPRIDPVQTARRAEIAIAVPFLLLGIGAVLVRNVAMAVLLLAGATALLVQRLPDEVRAWRAVFAARRRKLPAELPPSNERAPLRVLRGEASGASRATGSTND